MFNCPKCGKSVNSEENYCPNCGEYIMLKYRQNKSIDINVGSEKNEKEGLIKNNRNSSSNNSNIPFFKNKKFIFSVLIFILIIVSFIVFNKTPTLTGSYQGTVADDGTPVYVKYDGEKMYFSIDGEYFMVFDKISEDKSADEEIGAELQILVFKLNKTDTNELVKGSNVSNIGDLFTHLIFTRNYETKKSNLGFLLGKYESTYSSLQDQIAAANLTKIDDSDFPEIVRKESEDIEKENTTAAIKREKVKEESSDKNYTASIEKQQEDIEQRKADAYSINSQDSPSSELNTFADGLPIYSSAQPINNSIGTYRYLGDGYQGTITILNDGTYFSTNSTFIEQTGEVALSYSSGPIDGKVFTTTSSISVVFSNVEDYLNKKATKTNQLFEGDFYENGAIKIENFGFQGSSSLLSSRNEDSLVLSTSNGEIVYNRVPDEYQYKLEEIIKEYDSLVVY